MICYQVALKHTVMSRVSSSGSKVVLPEHISYILMKGIGYQLNAGPDMQSLNQEVIAEGKKKVDVLQATKDFKKGIYGLQWEHTRGAMEVPTPSFPHIPPPTPPSTVNRQSTTIRLKAESASARCDLQLQMQREPCSSLGCIAGQSLPATCYGRLQKVTFSNNHSFVPTQCNPTLP